MKTIAAPLALSTLVACLCGGATGWFLEGQRADAPAPPQLTQAPQNHAAPEEAHAPSKPKPSAAKEQTLAVRELTPIVTNIEASESRWIRLQAAALFDAKAATQSEVLFAQIGADILAFLRTEPMKDLEGIDGLRALQQELSERAMTRSEGAVREILILSMVVQ